ncbi:flocculation protein FLO11-like [Ischnura elegans]|uniref:flocculation protein FLO11-like n=1 Tax=Ischnura elegans TaxID=197161 RepID=UPI001ED87D51|nr:flocculation protein FLO11-like [Ischnura elegans]
MPEIRVQVLYDFEYTTKEGREVWMREGERLYLIKKTNPDWWQVLRNSERRPFYVPSAYVEEVHPKKTKNSFRSNRLDEVEPRTSECDAGERSRPYLNGRGKKLEEGHRATIKQLQQHHQRLSAASQERRLEESRQRRRRGADYEIASLLPQVSLSHRGRGGDTDGSADKEEDNTPIRRETSGSVVDQRDIRGRHSSSRFRGRRIVDEEEDYRFVEGGEGEEDRGRQGRSASLDHLRRRLPARGRTTAREATGARSGEVSSCDDEEEEAPEEEIRLPRPRPSAFASPARGVAALMGNSHGSRSEDSGGLGKLGRSSGRKSAKGSQGTKKQQKKKEGDELLPVPLAFRNLVYQDDEGVVDYAQEAGVDERDSTAARADENSAEVSEVAAHSASTLHTPSSPSPANTTLPRLLRPPTSPLRARSSPSTPTLPTATAHHHHHHQRSGTPPPSSSPSSAASSASSSPTYVSAAPFPETTPPPAVAALPPPRRPTSSTSTTSVGGGSSSLVPPPSPTPGQQAVRQLANGWAEYCDASGRTFFHNEGSGEKSWKPPRRRARKEDTTDGSRSCSSSPLAETDDTTSRAITIPAGWRESYDSSMEQSCYVNLVTGAKQ